MSNQAQDPEKQGLEDEGEGSRTAAQNRDHATEKVGADRDVDDTAKQADEALEGPEADELAKAEAEGMSAAMPDLHEKDGPKEDKGHGRAA